MAELQWLIYYISLRITVALNFTFWFYCFDSNAFNWQFTSVSFYPVCYISISFQRYFNNIRCQAKADNTSHIVGIAVTIGVDWGYLIYQNDSQSALVTIATTCQSCLIWNVAAAVLFRRRLDLTMFKVCIWIWLQQAVQHFIVAWITGLKNQV